MWLSGPILVLELDWICEASYERSHERAGWIYWSGPSNNMAQVDIIQAGTVGSSRWRVTKYLRRNKHRVLRPCPQNAGGSGATWLWYLSKRLEWKYKSMTRFYGKLGLCFELFLFAFLWWYEPQQGRATEATLPRFGWSSGRWSGW